MTTPIAATKDAQYIAKCNKKKVYHPYYADGADPEGLRRYGICTRCISR